LAGINARVRGERRADATHFREKALEMSQLGKPFSAAAHSGIKK
jgi:hypothetical protein